ncbi:MAG: Nramp family divalent metal transporter [Planctomycetia bacterium]|nr:Nramp family divalent metal transporter [Planctomycetia bacterium]
MSQDTATDRPQGSSPGISTVQSPPTTWRGIARQLGPGLIIAGSIVGSGELIMTTRTGAQAGISLLWLIVVGCVIKVFVQIELGRYAVSSGETTLTALNRVPGPRWKLNWIVWFWLAMIVAGFGQLGGIIGGVGQSLAIALPMTGDYRAAVALPSEGELKNYLTWQQKLPEERRKTETKPETERSKEIERLNRVERGQKYMAAKLDGANYTGAGPKAEKARDEHRQRARQVVADVTEVMQLEAAAKKGPLDPAAKKRLEVLRADIKKILDPYSLDDRLWCAVIAAVTIALLVRGKYGIVEFSATLLVVSFTFVTIGNVFALQTHVDFHFTMADLAKGFGLPESQGEINPIVTALATFGIIGVGASELVTYPYWCLEKGYARFAGPRSPDESWTARARGWMKVMHYDAFVSMALYTIATLAFFLTGASVLYRQGLDPDGMRMVSTLMEQYRPVFGDYTAWLFLVGAFAVLYSTLLVATASHARTLTDCCKVVGLMSRENAVAHKRSVAILCVAIPLIALAIHGTGANPVTLITVGGFMQAILLPMLGLAALYFRFQLSDERLRPGRVWDALLVLSCLGMLVAGVWGGYEGIQKLVKLFNT